MNADTRRILSKGLMGRPGRLEVAAWVVLQPTDSWFTQRDAAVGTGLMQPEVRANLEDFTKYGLLERRDNRWPHYRMVRSPIWDALAGLAQSVKEHLAGDARPRPRRRRLVHLPNG